MVMVMVGELLVVYGRTLLVARLDNSKLCPQRGQKRLIDYRFVRLYLKQTRNGERFPSSFESTMQGERMEGQGVEYIHHLWLCAVAQRLHHYYSESYIY